MKYFLVFLIFLSYRAWPLTSLPGAATTRVEGGQVSPFWLESISQKKNDENSSNNKQGPNFTVASFEAMVNQVTVREFKSFLKQNPKWQKSNISTLMADSAFLENLNRKDTVEQSPMTNISWFAASAYCESIGMRLPTTTEWEFMAAASETVKDASGDAKFLGRILDWYGQPQTTGPKPVASLYKNIYGVWDLHGNVWEWVSDFNSNFITGESREDSALNKDMFCGAGGLAGGNKENYAAFMRYAFRSSLKGKSSTNNLGFRCVRSL